MVLNSGCLEQSSEGRGCVCVCESSEHVFIKMIHAQFSNKTSNIKKYKDGNNKSLLFRKPLPDVGFLSVLFSAVIPAPRPSWHRVDASYSLSRSVNICCHLHSTLEREEVEVEREVSRSKYF